MYENRSNFLRSERLQEIRITVITCETMRAVRGGQNKKCALLYVVAYPPLTRKKSRKNSDNKCVITLIYIIYNRRETRKI